MHWRVKRDLLVQGACLHASACLLALLLEACREVEIKVSLRSAPAPTLHLHTTGPHAPSQELHSNNRGLWIITSGVPTVHQGGPLCPALRSGRLLSSHLPGSPEPSQLPQNKTSPLKKMPPEIHAGLLVVSVHYGSLS